MPPASPQPRATNRDLPTPSPPNRSGHASFSHTPLSLCISGSLRQPAQLRAALPAAGRQLRAQRGSGQPPRGSAREGAAPLRSARNRGGPAHPGLGSTALLSTELLRAPLPARTRSGTGTETPRSHRTNGPGWRPRQRGIRAAAAGNLCAQVAGEAAPIPGCQQRVEKLRSPPAQSPSARAAPPSLAAGRPAAPPSPPSAGAALTAPRRSARARPRPRAHLPRSSRPAPAAAARTQRRSVGARRRPAFIGPAARPAPPAPPPRGRAARGARGEVPLGPAPLRRAARGAAWPARPRRPRQRGNVGLPWWHGRLRALAMGSGPLHRDSTGQEAPKAKGPVVVPSSHDAPSWHFR